MAATIEFDDPTPRETERLTWDRWANRKRLHISMGVCAATCGYLVQIVWDSLGSYMLTPGGVPLPEVDQAVAWSLDAMLNPSFPFLLSHRTFGNFSYVLLLTGGVLALRYMSQKRKNPAGENAALFHDRFLLLFRDACNRLVLCQGDPKGSAGCIHGDNGGSFLGLLHL